MKGSSLLPMLSVLACCHTSVGMAEYLRACERIEDQIVSNERDEDGCCESMFAHGHAGHVYL